jgi:hypothetical protein
MPDLAEVLRKRASYSLHNSVAMTATEWREASTWWWWLRGLVSQ